MRYLIFALIVALLLSFPALAAKEALEAKADRQCLELTVTGFESCEGFAMVSLVNSRQMFENGTFFRRLKSPVSDNRVVWILDDLPAGEYAVKVFHDENSNGELDTRIFGIPKEAYGFSNNARGKFGPPDYSDAVFSYGGGVFSISVEVR